MDVEPEELELCLRVLQRIADDPAVMNGHERFKALVAKIHQGGRKAERRTAEQARRAEDAALRVGTGIVQSQCEETNQRLLVETLPSVAPTLHRPIRCYVCKTPYTELHPFYHLLCPDCAALNWVKRHQRADLTGRTALVTGGRIKIGYQMTLRLLRDGARVLATTRFPADAARRFQTEEDCPCWQERLQIVGLDLRDLPSVEVFADSLSETEPSLDILVNNAAQTIRRPQAFYQHLLASEDQNLLTPPDAPATATDFPPGIWDAYGQQLDLRAVNSWRLTLGEIGTREMLEVQLVNSIAPFVLSSRLKPLLMRSGFSKRFIINVSAMEGQFGRADKTPFHPHTNMAKAALNMMTRTSSGDYAKEGIFMNSVDTGWITDEKPHAQKTRVREAQGFYTPLDVIDGMARLYDPIVRGILHPDVPLYGHFLKDYAPYPW